MSRWGGWRRERVPAQVSAAIAAYRGTDTSGRSRGGLPGPARTERLLAWARDARTGLSVVAGEFHLYVVEAHPADGAPAGATGGVPGPLRGPSGSAPGVEHRVVVSRPWHLVDSAVWERDSSTMRIVWVDRTTPSVFLFPETNELPETLRERVQGTVVIGELVDLGRQRSARVVVRRDLERGALLSQTILGIGVSSTDPGVLELTGQALNRLREQAGLD